MIKHRVLTHYNTKTANRR